MAYGHAVLMGDPSCFRIRGGANPHTRTRWGLRKSVDSARAAEQWHRLARVLLDLGVAVYVVPPVESSPGLVFPANAGFVKRPYESIPLAQKRFYLSRPVETRLAEREVYSAFLRGLGFAVEDVRSRFEGEADFFPAGDAYLFTSGVIVRQRFVPHPGWPPYRRVYGFRSAPLAMDELVPLVGRTPVVPLTLVRETHYHGDTCLCAFGPEHEFLMAYLPALSASSRARLRERFAEKLLPLSDVDGELFSANSFQVDDGGGPVLVMPHTASEALRAQVRERGVRPVTADVSEFMQKGGGSVKCLVGYLGILRRDGGDVSLGAREFRAENSYTALFEK